MATRRRWSLFRARAARGAGHPFYPNHVLRNAIAVLSLAAALCLAAALLPSPLGEAADPLGDPDAGAGGGTFWFLGPLTALEWALPPGLAAGLLALLTAASVLLPLLDRPGRREGLRRASRAAFLAWMAFLLLALWVLPAGGPRP